MLDTLAAAQRWRHNARDAGHAPPEASADEKLWITYDTASLVVRQDGSLLLAVIAETDADEDKIRSISRMVLTRLNKADRNKPTIVSRTRSA